MPGPADPAAAAVTQRGALDRRSVLRAGMLGLGVAAAPLGAQVAGAGGFTHGVASGEPGPRQVLLWTRYVGPAGTDLAWEVAADEAFAHVVSRGTARAEAAHDWCAKTVATGLVPGRWYFYRFTAPGGARSVTGRTRTLPVGRTAAFKLAVFTCANFGFGWFNAYAHAAARDDIDLVVHLGDYLYEYKRGDYPSPRAGIAERVLQPAGELITLADYRARYATYRADADLQKLHQMWPMVAMWDDHESANDSWKGGAENHDPATEGPWSVRTAAARRAYREWLPVSERDWESYDIGNLATLWRLESRLDARDEQVTYPALLKDVAPADYPAKLTAFRTGAWSAPARTLLGPEQETWLARGLAASVGRGARWQVVAQQVVMAPLTSPPEILAAMPATTSQFLSKRLTMTTAASAVGLPFNLDSWDGYPAARSRLLGAAQAARANLVVLSGDSHNAWASNLTHRGKPVGTEFAVHSVTSPGFESLINWLPPEALAAAMTRQNPDLKWTDTSRRGYMTIALSQASVSAEFIMLDTVRTRPGTVAARKTMTARAGERVLS